jgi:radical SAM superfamily enzyme YgiQ (UPF0313 family)
MLFGGRGQSALTHAAAPQHARAIMESTLSPEAAPGAAAATAPGTRRFDRVLLVNPPSGLYRRDDRCQCKVEDQTVDITFPPIELCYAAAMARRAGAEVMVRDYPAVGAAWEDYLADLRDFRPDLLVVSATTATIELDMQAAQAARDVTPDIFVLAKGEYLNYFADELLPKRPEIDAIAFGEIEETMEELVAGKPFGAICGLVWRDDAGKTRRNPSRPFGEHLDDLPIPARDLIENSRYTSPENGRPLTVLHANRGCPAKCIYCPAGVISGYNVRLRSPELVVDEIEECVNRYGIRDFLFHGDTFTINKRWLLKLCDLILERKLDIHWGCNSRVDTIDDERAQAMKNAGCWVVAFGFEHSDQEMLDNMKKGARVEKAFTARECCRRNGLCCQAFMVVGLPWETKESLARVEAFLRKLDPDFFDLNIAYPLPGTELYEIAKRENLIEIDDLAEGGYATAAMRTYTLSPAFLTEWRRKALLRLNLRPRYVTRTLWRAAQTGTLTYYVKAGLRRFNRLFFAEGREGAREKEQRESAAAPAASA